MFVSTLEPTKQQKLLCLTRAYKETKIIPFSEKLYTKNEGEKKKNEEEEEEKKRITQSKPIA